VPVPRFGLNRFDSRSVDLFAADVRRAEQLGWDAALQPDSQLRRRDTYVLLAAAARVTERITLVNGGKTMEVEYTLVDPQMWEGDWKSTKRYNRADYTDINEANCILQYNANLPGTNLGSETAEERGQTELEGESE
jgi:hypothetical protein